MRPKPKLLIEQFGRTDGVSYVPASQSLEPEALGSELARVGRLESAGFRAKIAGLKMPFAHHRKLWELAYILEALEAKGKVFDGARGLAFAVGLERTPAYLAAHGCTIVATDLGAEDAFSEVWNKSDQWSGSIKDLIFEDVCPSDVMEQRVSFRPVDMNKIPDDLVGFDFTWSTCSFEHCGSIELGLQFIHEQMKCLKPGGVAVHTTELNLSSNDATLLQGNTVLFRLQDIERLIRELEANGHDVEPLDVRLGTHELDTQVDMKDARTGRFSSERHMRLKIGKYASTSIGLIITKDGRSSVQKQVP